MKSVNKVILLSFVCTILLSSCGYIQLRNNIHSLMNLKIEFPDSMLQFKSDSIDMQIKEICFDKPTIVYWIDSVDCSSCLMNSLYQWETIIEYGKKDSVIFDMAFIVSPPKSESEYFKEVVRHKKLSTPVERHDDRRRDVCAGSGPACPMGRHTVRAAGRAVRLRHRLYGAGERGGGQHHPEFQRAAAGRGHLNRQV